MWPRLLSSCPDCSLEAQPKYVRGGKRYGRRSLPEFQESVEEFAEVTVIEPLDEEARPAHMPAGDGSEVRAGARAPIRTTGAGTRGYPRHCGSETGERGCMTTFLCPLPASLSPAFGYTSFSVL